MARYVDGFVLPVARKHVEAYRKVAQAAGRVWREHGALEYRECAGEDLKVKRLVPFPKLMRCGRGETVIFAWIVFKSRAHRDRVNKKVMADPRMDALAREMPPVDMKRMAYGGFDVLVDL